MSGLAGGRGCEKVGANTVNLPVLAGNHKQATSPTLQPKSQKRVPRWCSQVSNTGKTTQLDVGRSPLAFIDSHTTCFVLSVLHCAYGCFGGGH